MVQQGNKTMPDAGPDISLHETSTLDPIQSFLSRRDSGDPDPFEYGGDAFMQAVRDGDIETVTGFIRKTDKFNPFFVCDLQDALLEAAAQGRNDIVRLLLDEGVTLDSVKLCYRWDRDVTLSRYEKGYPEKHCGCRGTALQEASRIGSLSLVAFLLERGADPNFELIPHVAETALQRASGGGYAGVVAVLIEAGARVNAEAAPYFGRTALRAAAEGGHAEVVANLLKAGADVNAQPARYGGRTALQAAAEGGHAGIVASLLKAGADVNAQPVRYGGRTALQAAAEGGHAGIVASLLTAGADVNADPADNGGRTALQAAAAGGHLEIVERLLTAGADVNAEPAFFGGRTALQAAAEEGHAGIVANLLTAGADVNAQPARYGGRTALQAAAEGGHAGMVASLLAAGADVNADPAESGGRTALQAAAAGGHLEIVERFLTAGADVNAEPAFFGGRTALQAAAEEGHAGIVASLLTAGADVNAELACLGRTALQAAVEGGHAGIVASLLKAGADVNAEPACLGGRTALQAAAEGGHAGIVVSLLTARADVNAKPAQDGGRTALQAAAEGGHAGIVASLLKARADVNAEPAYGRGRTALQAAAEEGHAEIVASLLTARAGVNAEPAYGRGRTALQAAAEEGHAEIVASLLTAGAYVNAKPAPDGARTALQAAAEGGHAGIVTSLLAAGADVNAAPARSSGTTALQAATEGGHVKIVANLLSLGPSKRHVEALDASPDTDSQVQQLSVLKDNLSAVDPDKCLIWSIAQPKVLQLLLHAGMDTSVLSTDGSSPLHCSVKQKNIRSAGLLLLSGVKTNIRDHDNLTPFDLLLGSQTFFRPQCLRIFLWLGCEIRGRPIQLWHEAYNQPAPKHFLTLTALQIPHSSRIHVLSKGQTHPATNGERLQSGKLGKTSIQITSSDDLPDVEWGDRRSLHHSGRDLEEILRKPRQIVVNTYERQFYAVVDVRTEKKATCMRQWGWCRVMSRTIYKDQVGIGLPSHLKMDTTELAGAFLTCSVSCDYLIQIGGQGKKPDDLANAFKVTAKKSTISWVMQKPGTKKDQDFRPILRTIDLVSTLDIGWVPEDAVDFLNSYIVGLHKKWRILLEEADIHLDNSRKILLKKQGKSAGFIEVLLLDAQTWSESRSLLQTQVRTARDILTDFLETKYLQDEIVDAVAALFKLAEAINKMEAEVLKEIKDLDDKTQKMIELEFNLVSIYESRTSKEMGMSMKRLSWITFTFLPLMFVTSLFGMNINIINGGPKWTWVIILVVCLFTVVISIWGLLKCFPIDEWIQEHREQVNTANLKGNTHPTKSYGWGFWQKEAGMEDLASGGILTKEQVNTANLKGNTHPKSYGWGFWRNEAYNEDLESGGTFQFTRPERRWTSKLKDH